MSNPKAYLREIQSLNEEIKRTNKRLKELRQQRRSKQTLLYKYMTEHELEKYEGVTINSIRPSDIRRRKPEKEKKRDAIELFRNIGIGDPEEFYVEFKATQKSVPVTEGEENPYEIHSSPKKRRRNKGEKQDYDPFLGF